MKQRLSTIQSPVGRTLADFLLITLLGSPLLTPLLRWTAVPCTHDGHLHYHRVAALRHMWGEGLFFSRWLPDLAFGYGYPFFIYREPLPLYLTGLVHALGVPLPAASNLLYILSLLAGGWFTYLWVRDLFGRRAGLVSAVAYLSAPYLLADVLVRGNLVESVGLALLPLLAWSGRRFVIAPAVGSFLTAVLGLAALSLSHNISLLIFTPMLLVYLLAAGRLRRVGWRLVLTRLVLLFGLGLGLTAFHTGVALLELDEVTISQSTTTRNNDFRFNFAGLDEVFAPVAPEDPGLINPPLPFRLGWAATALAMLGLAGLARFRDPERRWHLILMGGATAVLLFMALPAARPLWEALPLIEFVQFPWRFVGRAALPVAFLAGSVFGAETEIERRVRDRRSPIPSPQSPFRIPHSAIFVAIALLLLEAFPLLYPNFCREAPFPDITAVHNYEHSTGLVGVDPEGSYFPVTVQARPDGSPLEADYRAGRPPQRLQLPPEATAVSVDYAPTRVEATVDGERPFTARYLSFAFPGWTAEVDGQSVPITPDEPAGLITFPVPSGRHTVVVRWGLTPGRAALGMASLAALAGTAAVALWLWGAGKLGSGGAGGQGRDEQQSTINNQRTTTSHRSPATRHLALLALALLAAKLVVDRVETPLRRLAQPPVTQTAALVAGELRLEGYAFSRERVPAGGTFDVDLAWRALAAPAYDYQSNVWLVGPDGAIWSDKETQRPRLYEDAPPTRGWEAGRWAWDSREVRLLPGTPPGEYDLVLTLFRRDTLQPLTLRGPDGAALGPTAVIDQVTVTRPERPPAFAPQFPLEETVGGLRLLGFNQDRAEAAPGDPLLLTLFWQGARGKGQGPAANDQPPATSYQLTLRDQGDGVAQRWSIPPVRADYPPSDWEMGERLRGQHGLRLAANLASGRYTFELAGARLGELTIHAPERTFEPPPVETAVQSRFGDVAALAGYSLQQTDGVLEVNLVWRAEGETAVSYRVFVHLVDESGAIVAQSDGEPAGWTRPTTGWLPGEYVVDAHQLVLPDAVPAEARLRVGLYDPADGRRLPVNGDDALTLPTPVE